MKVHRFLVQLVCRMRQSAFYGRQRLLNKGEDVDVSLYRPSGIVSTQDTISHKIGMGVYQGETIAIRKLEFDSQSYSWVVGKLQNSDLAYIDKDMVSNLLCLAHGLKYGKRFSLPMTGSQTSDVKTLDECPFLNQYTLPQLNPSAMVNDSDAILESLSKKLGENPKCQQCQRLSSKLKELCWCCQHHSCPPFYHKENAAKI